MKISYYHSFVEAVTKKFLNTSETNIIFCVECNRLPLYASENVIKFVEDAKKGTEIKSFDKLHRLMREDIMADEIHEIGQDLEMSFMVSGHTEPPSEEN